MTEYKNLGLIFLKESKLVFLWDVSLNQRRMNEEDVCVTSPHFRLLDSSWYLTLYPNGRAQRASQGWIGLFLHRADDGSPKSIKYTLRINVTDYETTYEGIKFFIIRNDNSGTDFLLHRTSIKPQSDSSFHLKITCGIRAYSLNSLQGFPNNVSCAVQTEVLDTVPCAVQTDVPDTVPCAIQTEIPDNVSREIQTEVPDNVTDKENSKDKDGSSLDTKEIPILRDRMNDLSIRGSDHDVTICAQDEKFLANRNTLSAHSPVFAKMLNSDAKENKTGTIRIEDCDSGIFVDFLLYVYSGRTENLTPSNALQLYYTADKYDVPILKEQCVSLLKTSLSITSICDVVLLAAKHQEKELLEVASEFFAQNIEKILVSVKWQTLLVQNPVVANELYIKSMKILVPRK